MLSLCLYNSVLFPLPSSEVQIMSGLLAESSMKSHIDIRSCISSLLLGDHRLDLNQFRRALLRLELRGTQRELLTAQEKATP